MGGFRLERKGKIYGDKTSPLKKQGQRPVPYDGRIGPYFEETIINVPCPSCFPSVRSTNPLSVYPK